MSQDERLAVIEAKLDILINDFQRHLKHHWAISLTGVTIIGIGICSFVVKVLF